MSEVMPQLLIVEGDVGLQKQLKCFDEYEVFVDASRSPAIVCNGLAG